MKYCPQCQKQYTEQWITFCSEDGTILIDTGYAPSPYPPPPGEQRPPYAPPSERQTWRAPDPNAPGSWAPPEQAAPVMQPAWQPPASPYRSQQPSQGLAIASMIVGLLGLVVGMFCLGPVPGIVALILGLVALSQIKKAPDKNGGKPFAIIGIVFGSLSVLIFGLWLLFVILGSIFG